MRRNKISYCGKSLYLVATLLVVILVACAAPVPTSTLESECSPACPTEPLANPSIPSTEPQIVTPARPSPSEMVPRITIDELKQKMESNADILIVDNRHKEEYDVDHIKGAISVPLSVIIAGEWTSPLDKELIFYCS
jgi:hypothetical protein